MTELELLYKYIRESPDIWYGCPNDKPLLTMIAENIMKAEQFERPDIYVKLNNKILAIEHFEFDASGNKRGGSKFRKEERSIKNELEQSLNSKYIGKPLILTQEIKSEFSSQNYIKNMALAFSNHYLKIDEYKQNLYSQGVVDNKDNIVTCFFIEDKTLLGCYYKALTEPHDVKPVKLMFVKEFMELLQESPDVNCILFGNWDNGKRQLSFMRNELNSIKYLMSIKIIDFSKDDFFTFNQNISLNVCPL